MHLNYAGKKRSEEGDKENGEKENVFQGVISHKWQPWSTSNDTIVKYLSSQPRCWLEALKSL